jgi:hypothetical protein
MLQYWKFGLWSTPAPISHFYPLKQWKRLTTLTAITVLRWFVFRWFFIIFN